MEKYDKEAGTPHTAAAAVGTKGWAASHPVALVRGHCLGKRESLGRKELGSEEWRDVDAASRWGGFLDGCSESTQPP